MKGQALLDELVRLAEFRGMKVRREAMSRGVGAGGFAVVRGERTVFVDERASVDGQIEVMLSVLRRVDWTDTFLNPSVRTLLAPRERDAAMA